MRLVPKQNKPFREVYFKPSSLSQDTEILIWLTQELRLSHSQGQLIIANNTEGPSVQKGGTEHATNASWRKALCPSQLLLTGVSGSSTGQKNSFFSFFPSVFTPSSSSPCSTALSSPSTPFPLLYLPPGGVAWRLTVSTPLTLHTEAVAKP